MVEKIVFIIHKSTFGVTTRKLKVRSLIVMLGTFRNVKINVYCWLYIHIVAFARNINNELLCIIREMEYICID